MQELDAHDLGFGVVQRAADGIVEVRFRAGVSVDVPEMERILAAQEALMEPGGIAVTLVDSRPVRTMTRAAQELSANAPMSGPQKGVAILVENPVSVMLGNIFLTLSSPSYPTRLFRSEEGARLWLLAMGEA